MKFFTLVLFLISASLAANSQSGCPVNMNFALGDFTGWQCYVGTAASQTCSTNVITVAPSAPLANRHVVIPPNSLSDPFGGFPTTPNGTYVVRLGTVGQIGAQSERISYTFTIPSTSTQYSLTFLFAAVYQEPNDPCPGGQPHFEAKVYDSTEGHYINCSSAEYYGAAGANGFQISPNTSQGLVSYKSWTPITAILDNRAGHILRLEFTNADCTYGGHWAYSYIAVPNNVNCSTSLPNVFCPGNGYALNGPFGYQSYSWWTTSFTQNLGTGQTLIIPPTQTGPATYALDLVSYAGAACRDTVLITVQPNTITQPANAGPDQTICGGASSVTLGVAAVPGLTYTWAPAPPVNPNSAQPTVSPTLTTSYVMTATDTLGCAKKDTVTVFVNTVPATFTVNNSTQCITGNSFQFNMSSAVGGSTYSWSFGDGTTSTLQNPPHVYTTTGSFTVKVKVSNANGCQDSTTQTINVIASVPAATISISGNVLSSSAPSGNQWYLNGNAIAGATGTSYTATVAGTYTVIVTLNSCSSPASNAVSYTITGIDAVAAEWKLRIAPNPVNDQLVISYSGNQKLDLEILDIAGRKIFSQKSIPGVYSIDLSKFLSGNYLVRIFDSKSNKEVKKIITKL